jgi:hypothetical protein
MNWIDKAAPIEGEWVDGYGVIKSSARRRELFNCVQAEGLPTVLARSALVERGRADLAEGVYSNKIDCPSFRPGYMSLTPPDRMLLTNALFIGHIGAGHCAWVEFDSMMRMTIVCVDCERASEIRLASARPRP